MNPVTRLKVARGLATAMFWVAIIVVYFQSVGITLDQGYYLLTVYSLAVVLLEYPTGIIGDYFSHKYSIVLGYLFAGIGISIVAIPGPLYLYYVALLLIALGVSLMSGSETALLHNVSKDFKKDYSQMKIVGVISGVVAISIGGLVSVYSLNLPMILSGVLLFTGSIMVSTVPEPKKKSSKHSGNIFATAKEGLAHAYKKSDLFWLLIFTGSVTALFMSFKWFYNPLFEQLSIDQQYWGFLISGYTLSAILGTKLFEKTKNIKLVYVVPLFLLVTVAAGMTNIIYVSLLAVLVMFVCRGFMETYLEVELNKKVTDNIRASTISLQSLLSRLFSVLVIFLIGSSINDYPFVLLFGIAATVIGSFGFVYGVVENKASKSLKKGR